MILDTVLLRGLVIAFAAAAVVPLASRIIGRHALVLVSLLASIFYFGAAFPGFVLVSALSYAAARVLGGITDRHARWRASVATILLFVATFTAGRVAGWDHAAISFAVSSRFAIWTSDMWLTLRLVTLFWEVGSGAIAVPGVAAYSRWVAFPMTLVGPLVRLSELPAAISPRAEVVLGREWWQQLVAGAAKLALGLALGRLPSLVASSHLLQGIVLVFVAGPLGFYLTIAGFSQLMQALASVAGVHVPDNFNWPIGRENIAAFWANWNMTATAVFRDYLFYSRWGFRQYNPYVNAVVVFTMVGLWHAADAYWILWGFLHGLMFAAFLAWRRWKLSRGRQRAAAGSMRDLAGRVATYLGVAAAWYLPSKLLQWLGVV